MSVKAVKPTMNPIRIPDKNNSVMAAPKLFKQKSGFIKDDAYQWQVL